MTACPICRQANNCTANASCWCMTETISKESLLLVPEDAKDEVCICQACAEKYTEEKPTS